ncbi:MAG TPA: hypothetical protein PL048_25790, partial [Leptospiraceae bacterium]|nr:hypothetical protein [Leptospiraceae bacterium]
LGLGMHLTSEVYQCSFTALTSTTVYYIDLAVFNKIIAEKPKKLKTRKELIQYYERIEKVQLRNGKSETGAIISQENDEVILHTQDGIRRIPKSEVKDVFYENQIKNR